MAQDLGANIDPSLRQLVDGFVALSDEYKHLAEQHSILQANLSAATEELALFKQRYSDRIPAEELHTKNRDSIASLGKSRRSLAEWLAEIRGSESSDAQEAVTRVREAELACFGIRNRVKDITTDCDASTRTSLRTGSKLSRNRVRISLNDSRGDIEQDFTTTNGNPGRLGCPFAPKRGITKPVVAQSQPHDLPTPRSSGSHLGPAGKWPRRMSFNDPIRPKIHASEMPSPVASDAGSHDGRACPIRFLGNHSPEEVAKYFEEHKHEIPRSHEVCVKRFQTNTDSIRELDAKYGSLPKMLQGLGQKHQPMLPETPEPGEVVSAEDERKSNQKVKSWAEGISAAQLEEGNGDANQAAVAQSDVAGGEERVSHFDRPLKEIRVGESPSRPWGVPIPSKYLDRAASPDNASMCGVNPPVSVVALDNKKPAEPKALADIEATPSKAVVLPAAKQQKGKCPFDHAALAAAKAKPKEEEVVARAVATEASPPAKAAEVPTKHEAEAERFQGVHVINRGMAFVADTKHLATRVFENHGTLIMGYDAAEAQKMLQGLSR